MRICSINDLKQKEVINVCNGRRLGYISNIDFEIPCGALKAIYVPIECKCFSFGKSEEICIPWCDIEKIGEDTILVKVAEIAPPPKGKNCDFC